MRAWLRTPSLALTAAALLTAAAIGTASAFERSEVREPCAAANPLRSPFFGDLHVHTSLSFDANALGVRNLPDDAYRFAQGQELGLQPYDSAGKPERSVRLERPLDFAAVTDHAELLGELDICKTPGMPGYDSRLCGIYRRWPLLAYIFVSSRMLNVTLPTRYSFCGEDGSLCRRAASGPWMRIQDAAERAYDRTAACRFTTFVAYEWSGGPGGFMTHRNVIFRNAHAPQLPISYLDAHDGDALWTALEKECETEKCSFLTIPHNTNLSGGLLFPSEASASYTRADAARRSRLEPLLEIIQHKGDSECRGAVGAADELCGFEKLPFARMQEQPFPFRWQSPPGLSFAREILGEGLRIQDDVGVNPYRLGFVGSTDTHLAAAGLTNERNYPGHGAGGDTTRVEVPLLSDSLAFNPGGLAVLWAEENSRDSLFEAMLRRETYATSGPRMLVRFFGGWNYPADLCAADDFAARGYSGGVPMGGDLGPPSTPGAAPVFAVSALKDAGTLQSPGTALERVQIVKISLEGGQPREKVYDVAGAGSPGDASNAADPELPGCTPAPDGAASLCTVWKDPDFDASRPALYYARVVERPSCRWSQWVCVDRKVDCSRPGDVPAQLAYCCNDSEPRHVRERAWTSPIWFTP